MAEEPKPEGEGPVAETGRVDLATDPRFEPSRREQALAARAAKQAKEERTMKVWLAIAFAVVLAIVFWPMLFPPR